MSRNSQIFNPYLLSYEYIPDGEPHVFDGKLYIFGSHDRFNGDNFCLNDYICYSADISDLTKWRYEGVIYRKAQDPRNQNISGCSDGQKPEGVTCSGNLDAQGMHAMYAPDVVRGADGKYYLYYCLDCLPEIAVAVCDKPDGEYQFLGFVRHPDRRRWGKKKGICTSSIPP
jgi:hypothetical protein